MRTIAVLNQKGGVGKTTTVANTAAALAAGGARVVAIDLDPQAHLTIHLGVEPQSIEAGTYKVLTQSAEFERELLLTRLNLWLLPANINLVGAETELVSVVGRETILREALSGVDDKFDYCLIDCPPSLGLLTLNALAAAQGVLIPLQPHFLALQGFGKLLQTIELVNKRINPALKVEGVLLCMYDTTASLPSEVRSDIEQFLANARGTNCAWSTAQILPTFIRRNIKLAEAPSYGKTIFEYEESCNGAEDYRRVAEFIRKRFEKPEQGGAVAPAAIAIQDVPKPAQPKPQPRPADVRRPEHPIESVGPANHKPQQPPGPKHRISTTYEYHPQSRAGNVPSSTGNPQANSANGSHPQRPIKIEPTAPRNPQVRPQSKPGQNNTNASRPQPSIKDVNPVHRNPQAPAQPNAANAPPARPPIKNVPIANHNPQAPPQQIARPNGVNTARPQAPMKNVPTVNRNLQTPLTPNAQPKGANSMRPQASIKNGSLVYRNPQAPAQPKPQPNGANGLRPQSPVNNGPIVPRNPQTPNAQRLNTDENLKRPPIEIRSISEPAAQAPQQPKPQQPGDGVPRPITEIKPIAPPNAEKPAPESNQPTNTGPEKPE